MATKELRLLRHRYKAAYTTYMQSVTALAAATEQGVWPTQEVRLLEEQALDELMSVRQTLLDALYAHAKNPK